MTVSLCQSSLPLIVTLVLIKRIGKNCPAVNFILVRKRKRDELFIRIVVKKIERNFV